MERLKDASYPDWPGFYFDKSKETFVVKGTYPTLGSHVMYRIYLGLAYLISVPCYLMYASKSIDSILTVGIGFVILIVLVQTTGKVFGKMFFKETTVRFTPRGMLLKGLRQKPYEYRPDMSFRILPHKSIRKRERLTEVQQRDYNNYGEVVMEYGQRTVLICEIANIEMADNFVRMCLEGVAMAQALARKQTSPSRGTATPPPIATDQLPE